MMANDELDQRALSSARKYMGAVAWPTVFLGLLLVGSYTFVVWLVFFEGLTLLIGVPAVALLTHLTYTILHEAAHGSISGGDRSLRWLNDALGYMAAWVLMIPLTAHRHEHMAHHRFTNDEARDPDFHMEQMCDSVWASVRVVLRASANQFRFYAEHRWTQAPPKQNVYIVLEVFAALVPRVGLAFAGYWVEALALFVVGWMLGAIVLLYSFAYLVHRPHEHEGRYENTSTILVPGLLHTPLTWLWMFQNYHSIHHLYPRVPFYKYAELYAEIEDVLLAKGTPVYRLTARGLEPLAPAGLSHSVR